MPRYRNILVGVDGSEPSVHALEEAICLARWGKGGVTVIHVAPSYEGDLSLVGVRNMEAVIQGPGEQVLGKAAEIAESHGVSIRTVLDVGKVHERIAHHARVRGADLVVLGARRTPSFAGFFSGRALARVVELCPGDVMVIPNEATIKWERMLFASRNSTYSKDAAGRITELAATYGGELRTLSVMNAFFASDGQGSTRRECLLRKSPAASLESVRSRAEQAGIKNGAVLMRGRFHKVVGKFAREERIGLIILASREGTRSHLTSVMKPTGRFLSSAPCPILFLKHP